MSRAIIFNKEAEHEYIEAFIWYEEQQEGLGESFGRETEKQLDKILENPLAYGFSKGRYRESSIKSFPFTIVYTFNASKGIVYISSIFHSSRNPKSKYRK